MRQIRETQSRTRIDDGALVELRYDARVKETGLLIDTTEPESARKARTDVEGRGPAVAVVGDGHLFSPLEETLKREGPGWSGTVEVPPDAAYGHPDPDDRTRIPTRTVPKGSKRSGEKVLLDGRRGFVESIDDDAATVNFNHPLAGLTLRYDVRSCRVLDGSDRVRGLLRVHGLDDAGDAEFRDDGTLVLRLDRGTDRSDHAEAKMDLIRDAFRLLDAESVRTVETYAATGAAGDRSSGAAERRPAPAPETPTGGETP